MDMRALIVLLLITMASAKLAPLLTNSERVPGRYIVKLKEDQYAEATIGSLQGAKVFHKYGKLFPGFAAELNSQMIDRLRASDAVEYIEEDGVVRASTVASWGLDRIDQLALPLDGIYQPIGDGNCTDVYVIDTGINYGHIDFGGRATFGYDVFSGTGADCHGHGTHCAGIVAGTQHGVAKATNVIAVRVLDCFGSGTWSDVISGCMYVASAAPALGVPSVASMSLSGGGSLSVDNAVQAMINAGVTVVVAAGNNDDVACAYSPARAPNAITVGATDDTDTRASFSNYGCCLDIFAPGVDITSTWIGSTTATNTISGTSMACPHVAGAAAILLGLDPTLSPADVSDDLQTRAIAGAVTNPGCGSPNLLLYIGSGNGGGAIPNAVSAVCGGTFTASSGAIASPNYPLDYSNNLSCDYLFTATGSNTITVEFCDFQLEFGYDFVQIYDGATSGSPLLGTWTGSSSPGTITGGPNLLVRFTSDYSVTDRGFKATYTIA